MFFFKKSKSPSVEEFNQLREELSFLKNENKELRKEIKKCRDTLGVWKPNSPSVVHQTKVVNIETLDQPSFAKIVSKVESQVKRNLREFEDTERKRMSDELDGIMIKHINSLKTKQTRLKTEYKRELTEIIKPLEEKVDGIQTKQEDTTIFERVSKLERAVDQLQHPKVQRTIKNQKTFDELFKEVSAKQKS